MALGQFVITGAAAKKKQACLHHACFFEIQRG
jgi:hypothetical protein